MSESKFTPGPWDYHFTEINPYHAYIHGDDKECIALMDSRGGLAKTDEIKANARLIAAAPDLLAACEAFVEADCQDGASLAFSMAVDAIAKAMVVV
jgi:hypothetical protein